ncbi:MAG TPA: hypothetical protein VNO43_00450 [Candidatus Eisenbacteria bacterium]|nr:hypothetical protein [Candidatus Eisenbacteria bacterium]
MREEEIRRYAENRRFRPATIDRLYGWGEKDRNALFRLVLSLKMSENHVRDFADWLEEISLRDGTTAADVLSSAPIHKIETDPRLGRADKLKTIKDQLRRLRFPGLSAAEEDIKARIRELKLPPGLRMSAPPGLEGGKLRVEFEASSVRELEAMVGALTQSVHHPALSATFDVLQGKRQPEPVRDFEKPVKSDAAG